MGPPPPTDYYSIMQSFLIASSRAFLECHNRNDQTGTMLYGKSFLMALDKISCFTPSINNGR